MLVRADYEAKTVYEINYDQLKEIGIKVIAFDLDSTVMKSKSGTFAQETLQLFENLKKDFSLLIISNNSNAEYIEKAAKQIDFPVIAPAKKPCTKVSKTFLALSLSKLPTIPTYKLSVNKVDLINSLKSPCVIPLTTSILPKGFLP